MRLTYGLHAFNVRSACVLALLRKAVEGRLRVVPTRAFQLKKRAPFVSAKSTMHHTHISFLVDAVDFIAVYEKGFFAACACASQSIAQAADPTDLVGGHCVQIRAPGKLYLYTRRDTLPIRPNPSP